MPARSLCPPCEDSACPAALLATSCPHLVLASTTRSNELPVRWPPSGCPDPPLHNGALPVAPRSALALTPTRSPPRAACLAALSLRSEEHTSELQSHVNLVC